MVIGYRNIAYEFKLRIEAQSEEEAWANALRELQQTSTSEGDPVDYNEEVVEVYELDA